MQDTSSHKSPWQKVMALPILVLLSAALIHWTLGQVGSRIVQLGESVWPQYGAELRLVPVEPPKPALLNPSQADREDSQARGSKPEKEKAEVDSDFIADLLEQDPEEQAKQAEVEREQAKLEYQKAKEIYEDKVSRRTSAVQSFSAIDRKIGDFVGWLGQRLPEIFVLMLMSCSLSATIGRQHLALRKAKGVLDTRISSFFQLLANLALLTALWAQIKLQEESGAEVEHADLPWIWAAGFFAMALANVWQLWRPGVFEEQETSKQSSSPAPRLSSRLIPKLISSSAASGMLCVPLYAIMAIVAGVYFTFSEGYVAGPAVYLEKLSQYYSLYLQVGLYVWAGMLLKRTRIATAVFAVLKTFRCSPELMVIIVVAVAAVPTAYSGASGIFVMAAGATVYSELRLLGARKQLALAASAMSGSLGVVLRPCLLVVIIAYMNPVSSEELFHWGLRVYLVTGLLFALAVWVTKKIHPSVSRNQNQPEWSLARTLRSAIPLIKYVAIFSAITLVYSLLLDADLDQHSAPMILPVVLILVLALDRIIFPDFLAKVDEKQKPPPAESPRTIRYLVEASHETCLHTGALLLLMSMSMGLGGVIERMELLANVPDVFGTTMVAMALLVVILLVIGMLMDPYGAVILVSGGLAQIAYQNGINPIHFWMVVLVAFELGYLTPPVALNQLLVRQVVGELQEPWISESSRTGFWWRYEKILLPIVVMATALILVAFVPLMWS